MPRRRFPAVRGVDAEPPILGWIEQRQVRIGLGGGTAVLVPRRPGPEPPLQPRPAAGAAPDQLERGIRPVTRTGY